MRNLTALVLACAVAVPVLAQTPPPPDPPEQAFDLPKLAFDLDSKHAVLAAPEQTTIAPLDLSAAVLSKLKYNVSALARMETIRRAAGHLMRVEDPDARHALALDLYKDIADFYSEQQSLRAKLERDQPPVPPGESKNQRPDQDAPGGVDFLKLCALTALDMGWTIEVFVQAKLLSRDVDLANVKEGTEYVADGIAIHPLADLSFAAAVLATKEIRSRHISDAVSAAPAGSVLDRNLIACFGQERIERVRAAVSPLRRGEKDKD